MTPTLSLLIGQLALTVILPFASAWVTVTVTCTGTVRPPYGIVPLCAHSRREWLASSAAAAAATVTASSWWTTHPALALETVFAETLTKTTPSTCDPSVSVWKNPSNGRKVYLLGTAHISDSSAQLAGVLIEDVRPDAVFIELDAKRIKRVSTGATSREGTSLPPPTSQMAGASQGGFPVTGDLETVQDGPANVPAPTTPQPTERKIKLFDMKQRALMAGSAAVGGAIQGMYNNLNKSGFNAGEEFVIAIQEGQRVGATIILGDRDVEVTLQRLTQALTKTDLKTLLQPNSELEQTMASILPSSQPLPSSDNVNFKEEMTAYVETMKAKENVRQIMSQLRRAAPELYEALVAERDAYMANGLDKLSIYPTIVAVMGIAHVDGVEAILASRGWVSVPLSCPTRKMP